MIDEYQIYCDTDGVWTISPSYISAMAARAALKKDTSTLRYIKGLIDGFRVHDADLKNYQLMINTLIEMSEVDHDS